jgi:hypothetical protein
MADGQVEQIPDDTAGRGVNVPRLGRHIRHDPLSRNFPLPRTGVDLTTSVSWRNWGGKLDQLDIGACTGFAGAHCLNHMPLRASLRPARTLKAADALDLYRWATRNDPWPGVWEPDDTGSSGLAVCQAMVASGKAREYRWAFGFDHGRAALREGPLMQGSYWTWDMFSPDADGRVHPVGVDAGGHEYLWVGDDVKRQRSWFLNNWGASWGIKGKFYMTWDDHRALLERDGDLVRPVA